MNNRNRLLSYKDYYSAKLNSAIDHIAEKKYTRAEALHYLNQDILAGGRDFIEAQFEYLNDNITGCADEKFLRFALDFIEIFYLSYCAERYKATEFCDLETQWYTELNSILISYMERLQNSAVTLSILSALALYSTEKHVSKCHFNSICDRLPFSEYFHSLNTIGLNTDTPSGECFCRIFYKNEDLITENRNDPLKDEFFTYFENLKTAIPGISDKA